MNCTILSTIMKSINYLQSLGVSSLGDKLYASLLKQKSASVSELARLTGKHRPAVYKAISELVAAGLVSPSKQGKRLTYRAESPMILFNLHKKQSERLNELIPKYVKMFERKDQTPKITVLEGKRGIATAYEQLMTNLEKKGRIYRAESPSQYGANKKYYPLAYWRRANSKGDVDKFVITNEKTNLKRRKTLNRFSKSVSKKEGEFEQDITQLIVNNKVVFIDYQTETVIMIENPRLAAHQQHLFKSLFEKLED